MNIILRKRIAIVFFLTSIIVLTISGFLGYTRYQRSFKEVSNIIESYQTIRAANQALISLHEAALEVSIFLLSKETESIKKLPEVIISAQVNMATLYQLTQDDATEIQLFKKLNPLFEKKIEFLKNIVQVYFSGKKELALKIASDSNRLKLMDDITQLIIDIKKIEVGQKDESIADYRLNKIEADKFLIFAGTFNVLIFIFLYIIVRRFLD